MPPLTRSIAMMLTALSWAASAHAFDLRAMATNSAAPLLELHASDRTFFDGEVAYGATLTVGANAGEARAPLLQGDLHLGGGGLSGGEQPAFARGEISTPFSVEGATLRPFLGASAHAGEDETPFQGRAALGLNADLGAAGALSLRADRSLGARRETDMSVSLGYGLAF